MKEKLLPFILKFIALSLILFALWHWKGEYYYFLFFNSIVPPLLRLFGIELILSPLLVPLFYNFLPFISLILITRGLKPKEMLKKLSLGLFLIFLWQILLAEILFLIHTRIENPASPAFALYFILTLLNYSIPFALWLILARKNLYTWFVPQ
ncbi:MAG: hypothetical protein V1890_03330 [Candidatus Zixiibacteriota bacterium]